MIPAMRAKCGHFVSGTNPNSLTGCPECKRCEACCNCKVDSRRIVKVRSGWRVYGSDGTTGPAFNTKRAAQDWISTQAAMIA